jgi:hypothetical protein
LKFEKAMDAIAASLMPGEVMTYGALASMDDRNQSALGNNHERSAFVSGALAVTNMRLRFVGAFLLDRRDVSVSLAGVTSIAPVQRGLVPSVVITAGGMVYEFRTAHAQHFAAAAHAAMYPAQPAPPTV